jgi:hypothetical protein
MARTGERGGEATGQRINGEVSGAQGDDIHDKAYMFIASHPRVDIEAEL